MNNGWNCFIALVMALIVGGISDKLLGIEGWTPWAIGVVVFVLFVILLTINSVIRCRRKQKTKEEDEK